MTLYDELSRRLSEQSRVAVLGIGNRINGDDALGPLVIDKLGVKGENVLLLDCGVAPENFTGKVREFWPSHIVLIDSAVMGERPGTIKIVEMKDIKGLVLSTHRLPLSLLAEHLHVSIGSDVFLIGVEPKRVEQFSGVSDEIKDAVNDLVDALKKILIRL